MHATRKLWTWLAVVCVLSFAVLGWVGTEIYLTAPPIPKQVVSADGSVLFSEGQIQRGQEAWLSAGGQQLGTVWGHGSYVAPDWSADWLHREALALLDIWSQREAGLSFESLPLERQAVLKARLKLAMRSNTYAADSDSITLSLDRATAVRQVAQHYIGLFGNDPKLDTLREQYAMNRASLPDPLDLQALPAFFYWSAWATATDRPGATDLSYTSNWPHEPLIDNTPTTGAGMWSIASVILMIAAITGMIFYHSLNKEAGDPTPPKNDPLFELKPTASMLATKKYFYVVIGLILAQIGMGVISAHYAVEGHSFFGFPLADFLPFVVSRTIHTQFAVLWIATAWLATGLYIAPAISGREPKYQKLGVDLLFYALLFIVVGSTAFGWYGSIEHPGNDFSFWIGNQGLEFTSMGRIWQILLFVGLLFWVLLLGRGLWPALKNPSESRGLIAMVFLSACCIGGFYATSLTWGQHTHYSMIEYWRWWLVHLWVEGFFEVFATAVIALLFTRLGLIRAATANSAIVLETIVFLFGGILGTLHHLYFTGTPTFVIAIGAMFSALEVVPLALIGLEAHRNYQRSKAAPWVQNYKWSILCFIAVGFWNMVGAGLLGFSINTPIALYYMQGLNMTPAHGHAALFGVYGMLGIGLLLFCLRGMSNRAAWSDRLLQAMFWLLNIGLAMMVFISLVPAGIYQAAASISQGMWYARSPAVVHSHFMETLVWMRVPGDVIFALGSLCLAWFALRLLFKKSV
ncbi:MULTISPECIES: nitric-oxide reductase large subunit [unclassified Undibacterium]|uniref:nitric-oxide reductase large subunit n=1 Tax=unclassified Undibacterium TaxID=2630295 RepID=UPI002AC9787F|nr:MULTISPECIES: nitric-oxide reductase large subunit [unclassified Undibacterium]MEB0138077.1 nitric-oxide reductase large subunit [Undibacterium sp. CCC2.1]MEB0171185.1 nitric-oxide reductase large subunit [Undibacterium sp. CCC1.1]MEB0175230.1 nitric-oxide reductase large subunit [Undibacterium sp. CCC3.4]MEB0214638.1 nitric-oxide reductase large subunit [Undibacterium sp. 5I2]WPX42406.1 nitric-oxide reductase large subunit [Undibacterium sp. CCC3.4]